LELRRLRADLYLTFSLLRNLVDFDFCTFFELRTDCRTRGHPYKLVVPSAKRDIRKHFFANRVVPIWNALPTEVVMAPTLNVFKKKVECVDLSRFLLRNF